MSPTQGFSSKGEHRVCRLLKFLYGLKQASRQMNLKLTQALLDSGFAQSKHDYSLFTKADKNKFMLVLVYVDDLLVTGNDLDEIQNVKVVLHQKFKLKDLGELRYFPGIEFARSKEGILMSQRKYALEMISDMGLAGSKPKDTRMEQNIKLTSTKFDKSINVGTSDEALEDGGSFQKLIGKLLYLTISRPDISYAVQYLSQFMHAPKRSHYEATLHVVRYIKRQPGLGILMSSKGTQQ